MEENENMTRKEHDEILRRLEAEDNRQNKRIDVLERQMEKIYALTTSVERLAISMQSMLEEQKKQGARLETLEKRDGEMWRNLVKYIVTTIAGIALGYFLKTF